MAARIIELDGLRMRFEMLFFTNASPAHGRSLFLSLHGGGGAPKAVNDGQWQNQIRLARGYRPSEGIYVAPRAPTDALAAGGAEARRAFEAIMTMKKIDIGAIEAARRG
jgi:hypothetical protein